MIDENRKFTEHVKYISGKMRKLMMTLKGYVKNKWGKIRDSMKIIYERAVVPLCTYACEVWGHVMNLNHKKRLVLSGQRLCAIAIAGVYRTVSLDASLVLAACMPIDKVISIARMRSLVKKGARMEYRNEVYEDGRSLKEFVEGIRDMEMRNWQSEWENSTKGRTTYEWIKNIEEWLAVWSEVWGKMSRGLTEIMTGHGEYGYHLHKIGKRPSSLCIRCGLVDTSVHRVRECCLYERERNDLLNRQETWPENPLETVRLLIERADLVEKFNEWRM